MFNNYIILSVFILITSILDLYIFVKIIKNDKKEFGNKKEKIFLIFITIIFSVSNLYIVTPTNKISFSIIVSIIIGYFIYQNNIVESTLKSIIYWGFIQCLEIFIISIKININLVGINETISNNADFYKLYYIILARAIEIIIFYTYNKINKKIKNYKKEYSYYLSTILINIMLIMIIYIFIIRILYFKFDIESIVGIKVILSLILIIVAYNIIFILFLKNIFEKKKKDQKEELLEEKIKIYYQYYLKIKEESERIQSLKHDMKNHIICIKNIVNSNENAMVYIENIETILTSDKNRIAKTGNIFLDLILEEKLENCKKNKIDFGINIYNIEKIKFIEPIDICSIFSNIIDNAIEASMKINNFTERKIDLRGNIVNNFFVIRIENNKKNKILKNKDIFMTDKLGSIHGLGLKSVKMAVDKYNGKINIDYTENTFCVKIILPIKRV